jgi:hypothetical protein
MIGRMRLRVAQVENRIPSPWELYSLVLLVAAAIYIPLYYAFPGVPAVHSPLRYSGIACPLCGGTRAVTALALGRFELALHYNPLALVIFVALVWGAISFFFIVLPAKRRVILEATKGERRMLWMLLLSALIANWAYVLWAGMYEQPLVI